MLAGIADKLVEALKQGRIVFIGNRRVKQIEVETGRRGARIVRIVFENGEELIMYESHLATRSIKIV